MSNAIRTLSRARTALIALSLAAMIPAATAAPATPDALVERCIGRMIETTQRTVDAIHTAGAVGVNKIESLDADDKPVPVMRRAARKAGIKIEQFESKGDRQVNQVADKCLRILDHGDANPELAAMIHNARNQSIDAIHTASVGAHEVVRAALHAALEDEDIPAAESNGDGADAPFDPNGTN